MILKVSVLEAIVGVARRGSLMNDLSVFLQVLGSMYYFTSAGPTYSLLIANACFIIWLLGLGLTIHVLSHVVNTVYICYAMDKDVGAVTKPEVHDVYMLLPPASPGDNAMLAVQQQPHSEP